MSLNFFSSADCDEELMAMLVFTCEFFLCHLRVRLSAGNWLSCMQSFLLWSRSEETMTL